MKIIRQNNAFFLALLILAGMMSASYHQMAEITAGDDSSKSEIVQDHNFCAICGSLFKFTSQADFDSEIALVSEFYLYLEDPLLIISPKSDFPSNRAPPVS